MKTKKKKGVYDKLASVNGLTEDARIPNLWHDKHGSTYALTKIGFKQLTIGGLQ